MFKNGNSGCLSGSIKRNSKSIDFYSNINTAIALGKTQVPIKHKQLASNYKRR